MVEGEANLYVQTSSTPNPFRDARGVFAARDFEIGEKVCFFDGYEKNEKECTQTERKYALKIEAHKTIVGYIVPKTPIGVAQLVNDGVALDLGDCPFHQIHRRIILWLHEKCVDYLERSISAANIVQQLPREDTAWFVAWKPIASNDEVFYAFGVEFWLCLWLQKPTIHEKLRFAIIMYRIARDMVRQSDSYTKEVKKLLLTKIHIEHACELALVNVNTDRMDEILDKLPSLDSCYENFVAHSIDPDFRAC
jgi:hypothetical protein